MIVIVTGSSGLIGRWVVDSLQQQGHRIIGIDLSPMLPNQKLSAFHQVDTLDASAMSKIFDSEQPEGLIHLAARCDLEGKSLEDYEANRGGVRNICRAVRECGSVRRAIYTSSQLVCRIGYVPHRDDDYCPDTPYGESKVCSEKIVREEDGGGVEWVIVRPTTVWGPHMNQHYQRLLHHIHKGTYFHSGGGKLLKSYAFAGNIAHQFLKLLIAPADSVHQQTFFLADYEPLSLRDYCNGLAREMGARPIRTVPLPFAKLLGLSGDLLNAIGVKRFPYNSFRLNNIRTEYVYDMSKTHAVCGELPFAFDEGVRLTAQWYLQDIAGQ